RATLHSDDRFRVRLLYLLVRHRAGPTVIFGQNPSKRPQPRASRPGVFSWLLRGRSTPGGKELEPDLASPDDPAFSIYQLRYSCHSDPNDRLAGARLASDVDSRSAGGSSLSVQSSECPRRFICGSALPSGPTCPIAPQRVRHATH